MPPLPPWGWWRAHTGWAEPQDDPGPGQRALADQGGGGAARSCVTIKMLTKYAFGASLLLRISVAALAVLSAAMMAAAYPISATFQLLPCDPHRGRQLFNLSNPDLWLEFRTGCDACDPDPGNCIDCMR